MKFSGRLLPGQVLKTWLPALLLLVALAAIAFNGLNRPVSFDGAMNLQVAQSLAEGKGYVREYRGIRPFPREVQTNVPFVLPAAVVIGAFGEGLVQSQIVNFVYMVAFLALVVLIAFRLNWRETGLYVALAMVVVPGFFTIGMNGWGELIALFWWLAGTWLLLCEKPLGRGLFAIAAGAFFLGLAFATKTVMFIGIAATGAVFFVWVGVKNGKNLRFTATELVLALGFLVLPLFLIELWRLLTLGGVQPYMAWWADQAAAISWQTGVGNAAPVQESSKLIRHFRALSSQTMLPGWLLALWLAIPLVVSFLGLAGGPLRSAFHRLWFATALVVSVYLLWWLAIAPDTHVRLRRIEIGLILTQALWFFCIGWRLAKPGWSFARRLAAVPAWIVFLIVSGLFANDAIFGTYKHWNADMGEFRSIVDKVKRLPPDAKLFGKGFLSAPVIAFYADRDLDDIDLYTPADLAAIGSGFLMLDAPAVSQRRFAPELRRYPHQVVVEGVGYHVFRVDFRHPNNPFTKGDMISEQTLSQVDFTQRRYGMVFGLQGPSRAGWRWATTDAEILLRYTGQQALELRAYNPGRLAKPGPLRLTVSIDDCSLGTRELPAVGERRLRFQVAGQCPLAIGRNVRVQVVSDNLQATAPNDLKQHSYVLTGVAFVQ